MNPAKVPQSSATRVFLGPGLPCSYPPSAPNFQLLQLKWSVLLQSAGQDGTRPSTTHGTTLQSHVPSTNGCWAQVLETRGQDRPSVGGQTVNVTTKKDHGWTQDSLGRGERDEENRLVVPHCLWGQEDQLPWILAIRHLGHRPQQGHPQLRVCERQENTQQARPTGVQQPRTRQTLGKGTGKKEGTKRTSMPACPLPLVMSPGMEEEETTEKGRQPYQAALAEEEPSGGLEKLFLPSLGPEV